MGRVFYRARQFWHALIASSTSEDLELAGDVLPPDLMALFLRLHRSEQAHSLSILRSLLDDGEENEDLLAAALLHDVGKSRFPLSIVDRVMIVLGQVLFPEKIKLWGRSQPRGWKRPFVIAEQHAGWGAQMAADAGASTMTVALIKRHQQPYIYDPKIAGERISLEDELLFRLQSLDDES